MSRWSDSLKLPHLLLAFLPLLFLCTCGPASDDVISPGPIVLSRDSITLTVEPAYGGRITSLTYGGKELLRTGRDSSGFTFGSVAWPSPQADWGWPPPAAIDRGPYTVQELGDYAILLIGPRDSSGLVLQKRYRLGPDSDLGMTYWLTNEGDSTRSVAAWEVTRLPYAGRVEFLADSVRLQRPGNTVATEKHARTIHFDDRHTQPNKVFANLDTVPVRYYLDDLVLEKHTVVRDFYRVAPGHAPLEVYFDPVREFVELELQGDYRRLSYGETTTLRTRWRIARARHQ